MSDFSNSLAISSSGLKAQAERIRILSENISNADTPGYRRKTIPFEIMEPGMGGEVRTGRVQLDQSELAIVHDPGHPLADAEGNYQASNVNLIVELADAREAQRSYEANLKMFDQARQMSKNILEILRK